MKLRPTTTRRRRQRKGKHLKRLFAKVSYEAYLWLSEIAGERSMGIAIDEIFKRSTGNNRDGTIH